MTPPEAKSTACVMERQQVGALQDEYMTISQQPYMTGLISYT